MSVSAPNDVRELLEDLQRPLPSPWSDMAPRKVVPAPCDSIPGTKQKISTVDYAPQSYADAYLEREFSGYVKAGTDGSVPNSDGPLQRH